MSLPTPFATYNVTMTGGWVAWRIPNEVNSILVKNRSEVDLQVSEKASGATYFTVPLKNSVMMGSFNTNNQTLYFKATAATVVEIMTVNLP